METTIQAEAMSLRHTARIAGLVVQLANRLIVRCLLLMGLILPVFIAPVVVADGVSPLSISSRAISPLPISPLNSMAIRAPAEFAVLDEFVSLSDARALEFSPLTAEQLGQGISSQHFWLRFTLTNDGADAIRWVLHHDTAWLDNLRIYYRDLPADRVTDRAAEIDAQLLAPDIPFQSLTLSDRQPYTNRPLDYRHLGFSHVTQSDSVTQVYLSLYFDRPDSVSLNFLLHEEQVFLARVQQENLLFGVWYGVLGVIGLASLVIALLVRQILPVYYALFLLSTLLMWASLNGLGFQHLWSENPFIHNEGTHIAFLLFAFFAFQFSRHFLRTKLYFPRTNRLMSILQVILIGAICLRLAGLYSPVLVIAYAGLATTLLLPVVGFMAWRRGMRQARWYTVAWLVYSAALIAGLLAASTNLMGTGIRTVLIFAQSGSFVEVLLLLVAMGERMLQIDRDRRIALELAHKDPLTGLGNRRQLVAVHERLYAHHQSGDQPVFLVLLDLDDFKQINDVYSHEAGDKVLQDLAMLMRRCCAREDVCIRYGGDEFLIVMRADDVGAALKKIDEIRVQFAEQPTAFHGHLIDHTLSGGVIKALSDREMLNVAQMLSDVDEMLYRAKSGGGNCIGFKPVADVATGESLISA